MTTEAPELTDKERLFVAEYLIDLNATQAARAAGFAKSSANVQGHHLRRKKHVAEAIAAALQERVGATKSRVIEEISRLAFSNISDVLSDSVEFSSNIVLPFLIAAAALGTE